MLPGSSEDFVLPEYKKDLGKPYSKIYFYLCDKIDFERIKDYADIESGDKIPQLDQKEEVVKLKNTINISDDGDDKDERKHSQAPETTCPTCFEMYPFDQIEAHANICSDNYLDPIGYVFG